MMWNPSLSVLELETPSCPTHSFLNFPQSGKKKNKAKTGQSINKNESLLFKLQLLDRIGRSVSKGVYLSNEVAFINYGLTLRRNLANFRTDTHLMALNWNSKEADICWF